MSKIADDILKDVFFLSFKDELEKISIFNTRNIKYQLLNDKQIDQLIKKIGLLPPDYRNILYFRYCFNNTPSETDKVLGIENAKGKLRYTQKMLSNLMGLDDSWIDDKSMERACEIVLLEDTKEYDNLQMLQKPNYSKNFRRKLKDIKINPSLKDTFMPMTKSAAAFILVGLLSFSSIIAVNAEARGKVFDWIVEIFPKFSIFTSENTSSDANIVDLASFNINYIPKGFELVTMHKGRMMLIYEYSAGKDERLTIKFVSPSGNGKSYYDTENTEIEEFILKDSKAFTWESDNIRSLIWSQDGIECHISGNVSKEEILKVAESISN